MLLQTISTTYQIVITLNEQFIKILLILFYYEMERTIWVIFTQLLNPRFDNFIGYSLEYNYY